MNSIERKQQENQWEQILRKAEEVGLEDFFADGVFAFMHEEEVSDLGMDNVAEIFEIKEEYRMGEGERAMVLCLKGTTINTGFAEKRNGKVICLSKTEQIDFAEECQKADSRLLEKMKELVDFEQLSAIGIRETDLKNQKAFEEFYSSLEWVKQQFLQKEEVPVVFKNLWFETSDVMTRKEYLECRESLYRFISEKVQEMQEKYLIDGFSKIYLAADKSGDVMLGEYLEEQYPAKLCTLRITGRKN